MQTTALDIIRPTLHQILYPPKPRLYKCSDPSCQGYQKGHMHSQTCETRRYLPTGFRKGQALAHAWRASSCLFLIQEGGISDHHIKREIDALYTLIRGLASRLRATPASAWKDQS